MDVREIASRITADSMKAWDPETIDAAARLDPLSIDLQRLLDAAKRAGLRVRDWRTAVAARRTELDDERRLADRSAPADPTDDAQRIQFVRSRLLWGEDTPRRCLANVITILVHDPRFAGRLAYHAMREEPIITTPIAWHPDDAPPRPEVGPWSEVDTSRATSWLGREWGIDVSSAMVAEGVATASRKVIVDPLRDYLNGRRHKWDGTPRLDAWLATYLGAPDTPYTRAIGKRWLVSAVARALRPGCKVDCVLVLEAMQGRGKSTALRSLCPFDELFFDDDLPIGTKEAAQNIAGKWIVELGELDKLSRVDLGLMKAFITRQVDHYRPSYGRQARDFPRHCVFAGSTNELEYLRDDENRRFWPVRCGQISPRSIATDRDQLWSEAVEAYDGGFAWYVDTPELAALCRAEQEERAQADPWEEHVATWLAGQYDKAARECQAGLLGAKECPCVRCAGLTVSTVLVGAVGVEKAKQDRREEMRAASILRRLGWTRGAQVRQSGLRVRPYYPPAPSPEVDAALGIPSDSTTKAADELRL